MLALAAMVVSLGSCGGQKTPSASSEPDSVESTESIESTEPVQSDSSEEPAGPTDATILEVLDLGADGWELEGERVKVTGLTIQARFGTSFICGIATGQYISTLRGIQVNCREGAFPEFQYGSGFGAAVTVEGTVTNVNGRCVLEDAVISDLNERQYDANGKRIDGTGGSLSYCPAQYFDRDFFDSLGRSMSGIFMEGLFEIRSLPEQLTVPEEGAVTTAGTSFQVVFPGEYGDTEDDENYSLITVYVPAGLRKVGAEAFNKLFFTEGKELKVDDYINIDYATTYWNNYMGLLMEDFACQNSKKSTETPTIMHRWEEVADELGQAYRNPVVNLAGAGEWDDTDPDNPVWVPNAEDKLNLAYSYSADASIATQYAPTEYLKPQYVTVSDPDDAAITKAGVVVKPADMANYIGAVKDKLIGKADDANDHGLGWTLNTSLSELDSEPEEGAYVFDLIEGEGENAKTVQELIVEHGTQSVTMFYIAPKAELSFDNFAALEAQINTIAAGKTGKAGFDSALVDLPNGEGDPRPAKYTVNWMELNANADYEEDYGIMGTMMVEFEFAAPQGEAAEVDRAKVLSAWLEKLEKAGFVEANFELFGADCLYNPITQEILFPEVDSEEGSRKIGCQVTVLDNTSTGYMSYYGDSIAELVKLMNMEYAAVAANFETFNGTNQTAQAKTTLNRWLFGDPATVKFSFNRSRLESETSDNGQLFINVQLTYKVPLDDDDADMMLGSLVTNMDFDPDYATPGVKSAGLWNSTSHEFVAYKLSKDCKTLSLTIVWNNNAAADETGPVPTSDAEVIASINGVYAQLHTQDGENFLEGTTALDGFTLGEGANKKEAVGWRFTVANADYVASDHEIVLAASAIYETALTAADLTAFAAKLTAKGFVGQMMSDFKSLGVGYWKAETREFVSFAVDADDPSQLNINIVYYGNATDAAACIDDGVDNDAIASVNGLYAYLNGAMPTYFPTEASGLTTLSLGENKAPAKQWAALSMSRYTDQILDATIYAIYATAPTQAEVEALLVAAGFVAGATMIPAAAEYYELPASGWWNASTGELLNFEISGNMLVITIVQIPAYATLITVPTAE